MEKKHLQSGMHSTVASGSAILTSGFDPRTLKTAQLKTLLKEHNVEFPADARKPKLIRLFERHIAPKTSAASEPKKEKKSRKSSVKSDSDSTSDPLQDTGKVKKPDRESRAKKTSKLDVSDSKTDETASVSDPKVEDETLSKPEEAPSKSETSSKSPLGTPSKTKSFATPTPTPTNSKQDSFPTSSSKKRKSMLDNSDMKAGMPSKGNLFEIESGSESDLLSPSAKRLKASKSPSSTADLKNSSPREAGANDPTTDIKAKEPIESGDSSRASEPEPNASRDSSEGPANVNSDAPANQSKLLALEEDSTDSSEFDSALLKLKAAHAPQKSPSARNIEIAKLFNIDPKGIKPKPRSARNITPRKPIIISQSLLDRQNDELSEDEVSEQRARNAPTEFYNNSDFSESGDEMDLIEKENRLQNVNVDGIEDQKESEAESEDESEAESEDESEVEGDANKEQYVARGNVQKYNGASKKNILPLFFRFALFLSIWITLIGTSLFAYWYREQTFYVGYCGQEIHKTTIPETSETPQFLVVLGEYLDSNFKPQCVECPQHARCFPKLEMACYDDFYRYTPWYFNLFPNARSQFCVPDTKKAEKIEIMIDVALDLLRARNANHECGKGAEDDMSAGIGITDLHDLLLSMKAPYITEEEFEELWKRSISELEKEPEIIVRQVTHFPTSRSAVSKHILTSQVGFSGANLGAGFDTNHSAPTQDFSNKVLRSTALSHLSFKCLMSNTLLGMLMRFKRTLAGCFVVALSVLFAHFKYKDFKLQAKKVDTIYEEVLRRLQKQAQLSHSGNVPAYIGSIHLRDLILSEDQNLSRKMRLWQAVSRKVDRNSNVSHQLIEVHGEVMKVWEWVSVLDHKMD